MKWAWGAVDVVALRSTTMADGYLTGVNQKCSEVRSHQNVVPVVISRVYPEVSPKLL